MVLRLFILSLTVFIAFPAQAEPCPGFEAAMGAIEAALPPEMPVVVLTPPQG